MSGGSSQPTHPDGSLDSFILKDNKKPDPVPVAVSQEIRDRGSIFVARIYRVTNLRDAKQHVNHVKHFVHRRKKATHDISAWRLMALKPGKSGLGGSDEFELIQGSKDDGESWAGGKILKVMQNNAVIDAVVIVSRWYGGTLLGPARFSHIETCATEVCREFKRNEELQDCISTLDSLDALLAESRQKLATLSGPEPSQQPEAGPAEICVPSSQGATSNKTNSYEQLDLAKAKRLIQTRERSLKSVRALLAKRMLPTEDG
ncbi:ribosomal protein S5 domain 2-type protein [Panaeolus papilionaceus]|nr:ribosomal protein S5 domain 2-type protein [Panaeolus papilionaceus]